MAIQAVSEHYKLLWSRGVPNRIFKIEHSDLEKAQHHD